MAAICQTDPKESPASCGDWTMSADAEAKSLRSWLGGPVRKY